MVGAESEKIPCDLMQEVFNLWGTSPRRLQRNIGGMWQALGQPPWRVWRECCPTLPKALLQPHLQLWIPAVVSWLDPWPCSRPWLLWPSAAVTQLRPWLLATVPDLATGHCSSVLRRSPVLRHSPWPRLWPYSRPQLGRVGGTDSGKRWHNLKSLGTTVLVE